MEPFLIETVKAYSFNPVIIEPSKVNTYKEQVSVDVEINLAEQLLAAVFDKVYWVTTLASTLAF